MTQMFSRSIITILIIAFACVSLFMIAPVEDTEAWMAHACWYTEYEYDGNGNFEIVYTLQMHYHSHTGACWFVCPSE